MSFDFGMMLFRAEMVKHHGAESLTRMNPAEALWQTAEAGSQTLDREREKGRQFFGDQIVDRMPNTAGCVVASVVTAAWEAPYAVIQEILNLARIGEGVAVQGGVDGLVADAERAIGITMWLMGSRGAAGPAARGAASAGPSGLGHTFKQWVSNAKLRLETAWLGKPAVYWDKADVVRHSGAPVYRHQTESYIIRPGAPQTLTAHGDNYDALLGQGGGFHSAEYYLDRATRTWQKEWVQVSSRALANGFVNRGYRGGTMRLEVCHGGCGFIADGIPDHPVRQFGQELRRLLGPGVPIEIEYATSNITRVTVDALPVTGTPIYMFLPKSGGWHSLVVP
jgi:hypothetical protein